MPCAARQRRKVLPRYSSADRHPTDLSCYRFMSSPFPSRFPFPFRSDACPKSGAAFPCTCSHPRAFASSRNVTPVFITVWGAGQVQERLRIHSHPLPFPRARLAVVLARFLTGALSTGRLLDGLLFPVVSAITEPLPRFPLSTGLRRRPVSRAAGSCQGSISPGRWTPANLPLYILAVPSGRNLLPQAGL